MGCCNSRLPEIDANLMRTAEVKRTEENMNYPESKHELPRIEEECKEYSDVRRADETSLIIKDQLTNNLVCCEKNDINEINTLSKIEFDESFKNNYIQITLYPSKTLYETNIYVKKGEVIYFSVSGLWKMLPYLDYVNEKGHVTCSFLENFGSLLGKIGNDVFQIKNESYYRCIETGILYLYPFTLDTDINPSGYLNVKVSGGLYISSKITFDKIILSEFEGKNYKFFKIGESFLDQLVDIQSSCKLTFSVRGKWRLFPNEDFIFNGYNNLNVDCNGFPLGSIIFQLEEEKNIITDELIYLSKGKGTGKIYVNIGNWIVQPEGYIFIIIEIENN